MRGPEVPKLVFLLSDGRTHDFPYDEIFASRMRAVHHVDIWAYGTGDYVAMGELVNITSQFFFCLAPSSDSLS